MKLQSVLTLIIFLGISHSASAALFASDCAVTTGLTQKNRWAFALSSHSHKSAYNRHLVNGLVVETSLIPGEAALSDVVSIQVQNSRSRFQLMTFLSNDGFASLIYKGPFDGKNISIECFFNKN